MGEIESGAAVRARWVAWVRRLARPPLMAAAGGRLLASMPLQRNAGVGEERGAFASLEILGRTLAGLAPWLELESAALAADEREAQAEARSLALAALGRALDPAGPDAFNFAHGAQPLVDAAFLAHACLRAPRRLWGALDAETRRRLTAGWVASRVIRPGGNNWVLFATLVEVALWTFSGEIDEERAESGVRDYAGWYRGDGAYGDGPEFRWDYYNSFVIQPMLLDAVEALADRLDGCRAMVEAVRRRARRYAAVMERLVAPDGSFPPLGRSLAYRCGAFQHLALMALRGELPEGVSPGAARGALNAVVERTLGAPGTFDRDGWLRIGLAGDQPGLGETYITTASLYLCTTALLPLGLPPGAAFWSEPPRPWSARRIWSGEDDAADAALRER